MLLIPWPGSVQIYKSKFCPLRSIDVGHFASANLCNYLLWSVTYKLVNKFNQKRIHASVVTRDRFEMINIKIGPVNYTLLLIFAQDRKCPKTGQSWSMLINMTTAQWRRYVMYGASRFICKQITGIWNMFYTNNYCRHLSQMRST
jgi:hypothetical protein